MSKPRLLVGLRNPITAFSLQAAEWHTLSSNLSQAYDVVLAHSKDEFLEGLPDAEIVICWTFKADWYPRARKLHSIYTPAAGHDWIARDPKGSVSIDFGAFHGPLMRESLIAMMLHFNRRLDLAKQDQAQKKWHADRYSTLHPLRGQTVLILGYGTIGRSCANLLNAFGCTIIGLKRQAYTPDEDDPADRIITMDELNAALPTVDHVVCILPGGESTDGILNSGHFSNMKPGAYLYNLGRGNCYDESDLVTALKTGPLAGAGLDVFAKEPLPEDSELWSMETVLIMPHASAICSAYLPAFIDELIPKLLKR